jgi:hypothetical protein
VSQLLPVVSSLVITTCKHNAELNPLPHRSLLVCLEYYAAHNRCLQSSQQQVILVAKSASDRKHRSTELNDLLTQDGKGGSAIKDAPIERWWRLDYLDEEKDECIACITEAEAQAEEEQEKDMYLENVEEEDDDENDEDDEDYVPAEEFDNNAGNKLLDFYDFKKTIEDNFICRHCYERSKAGQGILEQARPVVSQVTSGFATSLTFLCSCNKN